ncbi:IclR family transcriptional regulator C-terminal domain-containing protein [Arcobacteraceae bacterium]|nr:IclR family transcriptional regulator C-terminal domain-containing protein [Arcobacteraceae bacterium]
MQEQIKSLSKGLKVYRYIVNYAKPIKAVVLCEKLAIDKSSMARILKTLLYEGFISYLDNSNEIIHNDIWIKTNQDTKIELLIKKTKFLLDEISQITNECSYLGIFDDYKVLYINQSNLSNREIKNRNSIGIQTNLYASALGKSILAFGNYNLQNLKFDQYTNNTIDSLEKLKEEIIDIRQRGFSIDNKEYQDKMCCVAVPLFNHENILIGALGISGNSSRLDFKELLNLGNSISNIVSKYEIVY